MLREHISEKGLVRSIQLPQPYTQSTGDNSAPDAHFNSSFPKSPQKSPLVGQCTFSHLKKRKKINIWFQYMWKPINTIPSSLSLCNTFTLQFSLHLWQMVNRNNGVWLLGGQGAAGGENKAADESAWAGITEASMALTSPWNGGIQWSQRDKGRHSHENMFVFSFWCAAIDKNLRKASYDKHDLIFIFYFYALHIKANCLCIDSFRWYCKYFNVYKYLQKYMGFGLLKTKTHIGLLERRRNPCIIYCDCEDVFVYCITSTTKLTQRELILFHSPKNISKCRYL